MISLKPQSKSKRMIPALGTFIRLELSLTGHLFLEYSELMFNEIKRVEQKLNYFDESSELSQLNRAPAFEWKEVSEELENILRLSQEIALGSKLAFDPGPELEFKVGAVRKLAPGLIDLGGIAKGYAVDCAVELLFKTRIKNGHPKIFGSLNAGGDLFLFEEEETCVHLEISPEILEEYFCSHGAIATSRAAFSATRPLLETRSENTMDGRKTAADYRGRTPIRSSVSVFAEKAVIADAFTKVALFSQDRELGKKWNAKVIHEI